MNKEVRETLELMRSEYEKLPHDQILNLGWKDLDKIVVNGKKYIPSVWSEKYKEKLLLVVQLQRSLFLSFLKQVDCIGSLIDQQGNITHVNEEFMWKEIGHP